MTRLMIACVTSALLILNGCIVVPYGHHGRGYHNHHHHRYHRPHRPHYRYYQPNYYRHGDGTTLPATGAVDLVLIADNKLDIDGAGFNCILDRVGNGCAGS